MTTMKPTTLGQQLGAIVDELVHRQAVIDGRLADLMVELRATQAMIRERKANAEKSASAPALAESQPVQPELPVPLDAIDWKRMYHHQRMERWAETHDGEIRTNDFHPFLVEIGVCADAGRAGTLTAVAIRKMPDFERVRHGVYRRKAGAARPAINQGTEQVALTVSCRHRWHEEADGRLRCGDCQVAWPDPAPEFVERQPMARNATLSVA